jgi:hypothetical protein
VEKITTTTAEQPVKIEWDQQSTRELLKPLCFVFTIIDHFVCQISFSPWRNIKAKFSQYVLEYIYWILDGTTNDWDK